MNTLDNTKTVSSPFRRAKPVVLRTYHTALHEAGASRLSDEELAIVTRALVILENKVIRKGHVFDSPASAKPWLILNYGMLDREVFGLVFLDSRHRYLGHQQLFTGTIDGASIHPRQVARSVFDYNAAAVCAVHCHPSFVAEPSQADELITHRLRDMLNAFEVRLLDHYIVGGNQVLSMSERGLL